ncbi:MAG: prolyl oligopeptidase family serine peptidase [Flavobacteriales bacterium]|nr:prolyl oligopeptidase family serine peptidase [Flavobacteriales bacterium]
MKKLLLLNLLFISSSYFSQTTIDKTIVSGGITRSYKLYIPAMYNGSTSVALVLNLHGLGSNSVQQMFYGDFRSIADTANFIIVHPQGTTSATLGSTYWNAYFGGSVNDINFLSEMIDTISSNYNIDINRIHSTGMSNGGYMSLALAAGLNDKIASVASVTGSMTNIFPVTPTNTKSISVLQIHGTADSTVNYSGDVNSKSIQNVLNYWIGYNSTTTTPVIDSLADINTADNCTAIRYTYAGGNANTEVIHYKVIDGEHTWPNSLITIGVTNRDFDASKVIWAFFNKHQKVNTVGINTSLKNKIKVDFKYNSIFSEIYLTKTDDDNSEMIYSVFSMEGKLVAQGQFNEAKTIVLASSFNSGSYIIRVVEESSGAYASYKFVVI